MLRAPDGPVREGKRMHGGLSRGSPSFMALQKIRPISFCLERSFFSGCPLPFPASFHQSIHIKNKRRHFSGHPPSFFLFLPQCPAPLPSPPIHRQRPFPVLYWMRSRSGINPCVSRRHHVRAPLPPRPSVLPPALPGLPCVPAPVARVSGTGLRPRRNGP